MIINMRQGKANLPFLNYSPADRKAWKAYYKLAEDQGKALIAFQVNIQEEKCRSAIADLHNAQVFFGDIETAVSTGRLSPEDAKEKADRLRGVVASAEADIATYRVDINTLAKADPLEVFDRQMQRFPALQERFPPPPGTLDGLPRQLQRG